MAKAQGATLALKGHEANDFRTTALTLVAEPVPRELINSKLRFLEFSLNVLNLRYIASTCDLEVN